MVKKSSGFIGTFGGSPKTRWSNVLAGDRTGRGKPAQIISTVHNAGALQSARLGAPVTRMGAYAQRKDLPSGSIDIRGYFGDERTGIRKPVTSFAAKPKQSTPSVVRTTVDMKTSPVKTAPIKTAVSPKETSMSRAQRIVAERQAAGPRMAGGKNVSYGFGNAKALGQSIAKSFGGGGQRSGGGMGGGMRSGGGRATDPSRGGMGYSGRGTGSKK